MAENMKPGGGGHPQQYIPKGNGDKSGEYTNGSVYETFDEYSKRFFNKTTTESQKFCEENHCTQKDLRRLLGEQGYKDVKNYTNATFARNLNRRLRHGTETEDDIRFLKSIEDSVKKFVLTQCCMVARGIVVDYDYYVEKYEKAYKNQTTVEGSKICSTSRTYTRALLGAQTKDPKKIGLIFTCGLIQGDCALPIESVSTEKYEKEIILTSPHFYIRNIKKINIDGQDIMEIDIVLVR